MTAFAPAPSGGNSSLALAFRFALRELRGGLKGFYIFIACIALGVAAIAGVASVSRALTEGISNEGQAILGGDMSFRLVHREADAAEYAYVQSLGEVTRTATLRAMARKTDGSDQALVELKSVDGAYPLYGTLSLAGGINPAEAMGRQPDGSFGAVADASLLARLGLETGDKLSIGRATVTLTGVIATEPDKLSGGLEFGPRLMLSEAALPETALVQPGSLVTWSYMVKLPSSTTDEGIIRLIEQSREKFPQAGWRIQSRASASPGLERNIERFTQFLTLVGLTALVVGGVGVANAVRAFLESKREVIASFKCLGASNDLVFRIYLIQMMIIAAIGIAIGLVAGAIIPFAAAGAISGLLPVKLAVSVYPAELGLGLVYGMLTALAFAIWPLGRAHDVPPTALFRDQVTGAKVWPRKRYLAATLIAALSLAAIAIFLAEDRRIASIYVVASTASFLLLGGVARLMMLAARKAPQVRSTGLRLAIANIHRPGALTSSVVLSLGLGLTLLVSLALIDGNLRRELTATIAEKAPSFFFIDIQSTERDAFATLLQQDAGDAKIQSVPMLRGRLVSLKDVPVNQITPPASAAWVLRGDRGITYQDSLPANSTLMKGEWWPEGYSGEPLVSFDDELATELGLAVGDRITVNVLGREITAKIANTRKVEWESLAINFVMVFSSNTFAGAPHAFLMTVTWDPDAPAERELSLLKSVSSAFPTVTAIRVKDALAQINDLVAQLAVAIRAASAITLISSILVLAGALAAGNRSRIYDAVILKTLGATRARLTGAYAMEYAMLGLGTAVFAVLAGSIAAWFVITQVMNGSFTLLPGTAVTAALAALVLTVGFGLIGTWRVLGKKPAPVLRNL
ncbi:macrolide transporter ATP-binding /permease protein [Pannonibacter phragmitetus]|uniref:Macrolide transporter ATP-binding /permease protein n=1 Tax=Pannonibacter phragmitetus TaxID=121719 RepID=A0A379A1U6_9HYPH|nr:ABC transporter permease [Pannonibacter phragmitetus]SUB02781.1 macrolide transporter ATP-binding /permease protein [Pannonibacter phragmitetus]